MVSKVEPDSTMVSLMDLGLHLVDKVVLLLEDLVGRAVQVAVQGLVHQEDLEEVVGVGVGIGETSSAKVPVGTKTGILNDLDISPQLVMNVPEVTV